MKNVIEKIISILERETKDFIQPMSEILIEEYGRDPYLILIGCLLSLRAKDTTTIHVCRDLFNQVKTPQEMLDLPRVELEKIIFKTGFYKNKAKVLHEVSQIIIDQYDGKVPDSLEELLSIRGIGIKTANLVMGMAFHVPRICVDTHVHRISNRLGLIRTKTPEETEQALMKKLPEKHWILWNKLLVMWGQNICAPISPKCSQCAINHLCQRAGVMKSR